MNYIEHSKIKLLAMLKINNPNLQLTEDGFNISTPNQLWTTDQDHIVNTKVRLSPHITTGYYGDIDLKYRRININDIVRSKSVEIPALTENHLSELIDVINGQLGTQLWLEDIIDVELPNDRSRHKLEKIKLVINPSSYFYYGESSLYIGIKTDHPKEDDIVRLLYLKKKDETELKDVITVFDNNNEISRYFRCMGNIKTLHEWRIDRIIISLTSEVYLIGDFFFDYNDGERFRTNICANTMILDSYGMLLNYDSNPLFENIGESYISNTTHFFSVVDNTIKRYTNIGYNDRNLIVNDKPIRKIVCDDDYLYVVYKNNVIRYDSMMVKDESFSITVSSPDSEQNNIDIEDLILTSDGIEVFCKPTISLSLSDGYPIVNNKAIVEEIDISQFYCWNPIIKFDYQGNHIPLKHGVLKLNHSDSIGKFINWPDQSFSKLFHHNDRTLLVSYKHNYYTGYVHFNPIVFLSDGLVDSLADNNLMNFPKWTKISKIVKELDKPSILILGQGSYIKPNESFSSIEDIVYRYEFNNNAGHIVNTSPKDTLDDLVVMEV